MKATMHGWEHIVRERLESSRCAIVNTDSVISELAAHLEETHDAALWRGLTEQAATQIALQEIGDWRALAKHISRAQSTEDLMNHRTKSLWLPALVTLLGASVCLMACQLWGMQPRLIWVGKLAMTFYWPWLATLPFFGAAGAYLSQHGQATLRVRLAAALSPALIILIVMIGILPLGLVVDGFHFFFFVAFALGAINWVAIPALALFLGALPFLHNSRALHCSVS